MTAIAVIGVGDMGAEMIPHLVGAGHEVTAFDIDPDRNRLASDRGAQVAPSGAAAAKGAEIVLGLVMSDQLDAAFNGPGGVFEGIGPDAIVVVTSTTTPQVLEQVRAHAPRGTRVLDAPIVGGVRYARERAVTFLVGGPAATVTALTPVLSELGHVRHVGDVGAGVAYKLITNVAVMAAEAGLREALDLADVFGMDYDTALDLMAVGPMAPVVTRARDTTNPRPLRRSAQDDDTLLSSVPDPASVLPISHAARGRLWEAVNQDPGFEPDFVDLTRKTTARQPYR
ncbi:NAD(P)-dependent oxidoreductase [Nocardia sp. NPDC005978]|uniref:NAD(P)-dependent oxidoreductase n=1 Tax=Nocardia sp. NPDC005978 TaxID=3156725 RepID=UPI0033B3B790